MSGSPKTTKRREINHVLHIKRQCKNNSYTVNSELTSLRMLSANLGNAQGLQHSCQHGNHDYQTSKLAKIFQP